MYTSYARLLLNKRSNAAAGNKGNGKNEVTVFDLNEQLCTFQCKQIAGNIMKFDEIERATEGIDAIVTFFVGDAAVSTTGITNVMPAAEQHAIEHVIYTSSGSLPFPIDSCHSDNSLFPFGDFTKAFRGNYFPITENAGRFPGPGVNSCFLNKWLCEKIGKLFIARGKVKFTSIRPGLLMHNDMTNKPGFETTRHNEPFYMLMTGQVRVSNSAHLYNLALHHPPARFETYNCSNDTLYNNLSVEKAKYQLGFTCLDQKPYMDFYAAMDWKNAFGKLVTKGFLEDALRGMYGFRQC